MAKLNTQTTLQIALNRMLLSSVVIAVIFTGSFINIASAANPYDLKAPLAHSVSSPETDSSRINFRYREETGVSQR